MYENMISGLSLNEVRDRKEKGQVNLHPDGQKTKSVGMIILTNLLTFFNIINIIFFILIMAVGSYKNSLFLWIVLVNTAIGIFQEIRTKKTLDRLSILLQSKTAVIREGVVSKIPVEELVLDDVMILEAGSQIPADAIVLNGEIEVNESLLTGEANDISKKPGSEVLSGSFVTGGYAYTRVIHVGKDNYVETISGEVKKFKKVRSELRDTINKILKVIGIIIIPLSIGLFAKMYFLQSHTFRSAIEQVVSSGIGMIPEGLYLLTTLALSMGVLRLAKKKVLVQELYSIETLARVDVLCLDKTGTLTEGRMEVESVSALEEGRDQEIELAFTNMLGAQKSLNETGKAILDYFGECREPWLVRYVIPFSSERKYSGASFSGHGTYYMGAQQILCPGNASLQEIVHENAEKGLRVIVLAHTTEEKTDFSLSNGLTPIGYLTLREVIRSDCKETLDFFKEHGVELKCISGDDPATVSKVASSCGFQNADRYVDVSLLKTKDELRAALRENSIFGRVRPEQKRLMVECLQEDGHTVGMTGDGVNDVLAMKQADCSIAMASGSDAARQTAHVVLLDSGFTAMPSIFKEGRRVINNIGYSAAMYLMKTVFSALLSVGTILFGQSYPFIAVQLSIISGCAVGIPTFFLQLEPSFQPIEKHYIHSILRNAVPAGITVAIVTFLITNIGLALSPEVDAMLKTICVLCTGWIYFFMLKRIYSPMSPYRRFVIYTMELIYLIVMIIGQNILDFESISVTGVLILIGVITISPIFIDLFSQLLERFYKWYDFRKSHRKSKPKEAFS